MVEKRPFDGEEIFEVSSKHARQDEHSNQLFSSSELVFPEDGPHISDTSGGATFIQSNTGFDKKLASDTCTEQGSTGNVETSGPGCISNSSWPSSEEDSRSETPIHVLYFSEYYNLERPTRTMAHCADIYSLLLDHPPRKPVPIGPNHQADIPACGKETSNHVGTSEIVLGTAGDEYEKVLMGTCVIPMPDLGRPSSYNDYQVGKGRIDCLCENGGSIRCVRQHIVQVREKLREYIGVGRFVELGLLDMGEIVADKWSDGEEQLFHKIVYSNPFTLGKKFWEILSIVFPSRSKMEIVSYYFNVFMLRRRAEQNRCYPVNIDSDNDEWQGSDDDEKDEALSGKLLNSSSCNLSCEVQEKRDEEIQDESCTSSDRGLVKAENWPSSNFNEYVMESWDAGYSSKVDLLPTCSMIEEVFGDGSWNCKARDSKEEIR